VCDIDKAADGIEDALCHINGVIEQNNQFLHDILQQVIENGAKIDVLPSAPGQDINVTVNCGSGEG
jgi:hypothetical protein